MPGQLGNGLAVHCIFHDAVTHAVIAAALGLAALLVELLLRQLDSLALDAQHYIPLYDGMGRRQLPAHTRPRRAQHAARGRDGYPAKGSTQARFQPALHLENEPPHLGDILYLAVDHSAAGVLH